MGFFSRKKNFDFYQQFSDDLKQTDENPFLIPFEQDEGFILAENKPKGVVAKHALTAQEVISDNSSQVNTQDSASVGNPLDALRQRVMQQTAQNEKSHQKNESALAQPKKETDENQSSPVQEKKTSSLFEDILAALQKPSREEMEEESAVIIPVQEEVAKPEPIKVPTSSAPEVNTQEVKAEVTNTKAEAEIKPQQQKTDLLGECTPFIIDDDGKSALDEKPAYTLESVDSILNGGKGDFENLAQKYNFEVVDETKKQTSSSSAPQGAKVQDVVPKVQPLPDVQSETIVLERSSFAKIPVLSDIDLSSTEEISSVSSSQQESNYTKRFDPVPGHSDRNTTTFTRVTDLKSSLFDSENDENLEKKLADIFGEENAQDFEPEDEYLCHSDAKRIGKKLMLSKRSAFFKTVGSVFCLILSAIFSIPSIEIAFNAVPLFLPIFQCCLFGITLALNYDIFLSVKAVVKRRATPELALLIACVLGALSIVSGFSNYVNTCRICLLACILLSLRALFAFKQASYILSNFRIIARNNKKNAVMLIEDRTTTFAMAHNAIEGDVLVAAGRKTTNITDYMRNATAPNVFDGKFNIVFIVFLIACVVSGIAGMLMTNFATGIYNAFAVLAILCAPTMFLCEVMPLYAAAKRLNRRGAMISGKAAINKLEMANACVLNSRDFFPKGTITLHNMQVLASNSIDETLLAAASVAIGIKSPLADIFKDIAATDTKSALPHADTIKYENQLGITGWVGDDRIYIGNRTLLEAHGIHMPSIEVDKKILRQGYFPVYVGCNQKACALLVIKYNVSARIAKELSRLCNMGVTLLVNNCDSNLSRDMLCDYFGLYSESVHIMSDSGIHMYKNRVNYVESTVAPAVYDNYPAVLPMVLSTAIRAKRLLNILRVMHIVAAALGVLLFAIFSINGAFNVGDAIYLCVYNLIVTLIAGITHLILKP